MNLNAWLTLIGVFASPVVAVLISLWIDGRRRNRDGKMILVRALMATRHLPGDPSYSQAINLLRVEFADCPTVMTAFKAYNQTIRREQPVTEQGKTLYNADVIAAQTKMLSAILAAVGIDVSEADLSVEAYAADAFIQRDNLYLGSLAAQLRIAEALERSTAINETLIAQAGNPQSHILPEKQIAES